MDRKTMSLLYTFSMSRRHFLKATTIAGGLAATASLAPSTIAGVALAESAAQEGGDLGIANFALTLEHLQNVLYRTLIKSGILSGRTSIYATEFGQQQGEHVRDLTTAIQDLFNGTPVQELSSYNFPAYANQDQVVSSLVDIENLGAAAYLGAAPLVQNGDFLQQAITIHTVEAEHATAFRLLAGLDPLPDVFATPQNRQEVLTAISPIIGTSVMPNTGITDTGVTLVGVAGGIAAAAAGLALARGNRPVEERS
jgi:hypothetical protein